MWICLAPRREHTSKVLSYGGHSRGILQFYLHTNGMNHTWDLLTDKRKTMFFSVDIKCSGFLIRIDD